MRMILLRNVHAFMMSDLFVNYVIDIYNEFVLNAQTVTGVGRASQSLLILSSLLVLQFSAVCTTALAEMPTIKTSLEILDKRVAKLCEDYRVPPPAPKHNATDNSYKKDTSANVLDAKKLSSLIEKNRAVMTHSEHQAMEAVKRIESALKKARTAFAW